MTTLKNVMLVNALSSGATGLLLILFPGYTARLFAVDEQLPFVMVGTFLLLFAALVFWQSRRDPLSRGWIKLIVALDILWVVESLIIMFPGVFDMSAYGFMLIAGVAIWVAAMAALQAKGLKQLISQASIIS